MSQHRTHKVASAAASVAAAGALGFLSAAALSAVLGAARALLAGAVLAALGLAAVLVRSWILASARPLATMIPLRPERVASAGRGESGARDAGA